MVRECVANLKDSDVDEVLQLVVFKLVLGESVPRPVVFRPSVWAAPSHIVQKVLSTNRHFRFFSSSRNFSRTVISIQVFG